MSKKTLAVDFDGVISESKHNDWKGHGIFGKVIDGCLRELNKLRSLGWTIIVFTARGVDIQFVKEFLDKNKVPYDYINQNAPGAPEGASALKVSANVYLDDRAITFDGSWDGMAERIDSFIPHYYKVSAVDEAEKRFRRATEQSLSIMVRKNRQRGDCWRGTGVAGAFIEMRAIFFRLRNMIWDPGPPADLSSEEYKTWKADVIDAMRDLRNFTILGELSAEDDNLKGTGDEL